MLIGVTGQIGGGKTTAAKFLRSFGAVVIDADRIGRQVVEKSSTLRRELAAAFGGDILLRSGQLNRRRVARIAFTNPVARRKLNRLVHPHLLRELKGQMTEQSRRHDVVVVDAALLLDWNLDREMDYTLVIHAGLSTRLLRLQERGMRTADARARQRSQLPFSEYRRRADRVILNNGTVEELRTKLENWYREITR